MTDTYNEIRCPKCEASIFVYAEQAGEKIRCPRCQNEILVPGEKPASPKDVSVDDLIDLDDDVLNLNPASDEIVAQSVDEPIKVAAATDDMPQGLRLAPGPDQTANQDTPLEPLDSAVSSDQDSAAASDDDLGNLIDIPETKPIDENADPFEVDENANLEVEGVTPAEGQFPLACHLCGSLLYARTSQIGTQIKCHDCYSMVDVHEPRVAPTPIVHEEPSDDDGEDAGYKLSEPVELSPIDTTFDITLGEIDYDDQEFFEKRRELESQEPHGLRPVEEGRETVDGNKDEVLVIDEAVVAEPPAKKTERFKGSPPREPVGLPGASDDDEYNLAPDANQPVLRETPAFTKSTNISEPVAVEPEADEKIEPDERNRAVKVKPERSRRKIRESEPLDHQGLFSNFGVWLKRACTPLTDWHALLRIGIAAAIMGGCYLLILGGSSYFTEENNSMQKFIGFAFVAFGGVPLLLWLFVLGVMSNSIIRVSMEGRGTLAEWPDFSLADWVSQFLYVGTSFWLSAFPGVIFGTLLSLMTKNPIWLFSLIIISSLMFTPFILASVVYNESPGAMMSPEVFRSFKVMRNRWLRFLIVAFGIGVMLALSILALGLLMLGLRPLCFLVAAIQVGLLFVYWWMLGDHVGHVVRWMMEEAENN